MPGTFVDNGTVTLDHFSGSGGTFSAAGGMTVTAGGVLIANGTIASPLRLDGILYVQGTLTLLGGISGSGTIVVEGESDPPFRHDTSAPGVVSPDLSIVSNITIQNTGSVVTLTDASLGTSGTYDIQTTANPAPRARAKFPESFRAKRSSSACRGPTISLAPITGS